MKAPRCEACKKLKQPEGVFWVCGWCRKIKRKHNRFGMWSNWPEGYERSLANRG